jgi:hypothetical protein
MQSPASVFLWLLLFLRLADLPPDFSFGLAHDFQLIRPAGWTRWCARGIDGVKATNPYA